MTHGTSPTTPAAQALRAWLDHLRRRWQVLTGLGVLARAAAAVAIVALAAWLADWLAAPVGAMLVLVFGVAFVVAAAAVYLLVRPLRTPPSDLQLARLAEERDASLEDVVVTATERLGAADAGPFDGLVVKAAADRLPSIEPTVVIDSPRVTRAGRWAAAGVAVFLVSASLAWAPTWRALQTARMYVAPPEITLAVSPGDARVVAGSPLRITARLEGLPSGAKVDFPEVRVASGEKSESLRMRSAGDGFVAELPKVERAFRYRVVSGSLSSREFQVAALEAARVKRIDLEYEFPAFTKLPPRHDDDGGDIYGPAGTRVRVRVHTDKPVASGALAVRTGEPIRLERDGAETELAGTLTIDRDGAYRVGLTDVDGLASAGDTEYFIRVMDDQPPDVRVLRPGGDRQVTRLEEIVIEAQADDDHGVASLELVYGVKGGKERAVPLHRAARTGDSGSASTSVTGAHTLYVEELDVQPGDFITYFARARDVSRGKRSTEARSDIFFLEVRPFNEEFFAAQSQAMMGGGGGAAADLLESQKEIIVATWKLQRRQIAGQSAEDVKAVGKAQGELRVRAQAMAAQLARGPSRRRGGGPAPMPAGPGDDNPLLRAAASMGRAETALQALKPNDAVPHEMAAYNALLKMQAEITRRQVARQRGSAGGGGGRSGNQDLSALFDEELLRQQETNYENRNLGGQSSANGQQENSALDKLKELARRQDEIAQRQRELARARAALKPEEIKRQLERLTREQEELRRETEALSQQMARQQNGQSGQQQSGQSQEGSRQGASQGQQASASGQSGRSGGSSSDQARREGAEGSDRLKEAAAEMANAARELSESKLDEAQASTDDTLERLRELQRRLSGEAVPDERRRAMGEMQLEARQVAEAQRKLANEARRAAAGGVDDPKGAASTPGRTTARPSQGTAPASDALRRLAAEQQRLAERVDALERRLGALPRAGGDPESAKSAAAARDELARQRLGSEMRRTAEAMRQSGAGTPTSEGRPAPRPDAVADRTDALAQAAQQVAERLGASVAGSPETRQLSDQLAQLRGARERLDAAEARLREAAKRASAESREAGEAAGSRGARGAASRPGQPQSASGDRSAAGQQATGSESSGQSAQGGGRGGQGNAQSDLARLQTEYDRALRETRELMDAIGRQGGDRAGNGRQDGATGTPEHHEFSRSAPGTEAFKQDYARWDVLTKGVNNALEEVEASLARRLSEHIARDRVHAGTDERAPAAYADSVSRYYRSLARRAPQ
jgi:hypothetical protein